MDTEEHNMELRSIPVSTDITPLQDAITLRGAYKTYGRGKTSVKVLENFKMTVKRGMIYGLLGASGCGKTTVLSCVVGILQLDSGDVRVFHRKPNTKECGVPGPLVGYMPQNKGLNLQLTIWEIICYFGHIQKMVEKQIRLRLDFLLKLLQLPDEKRQISTLSGGQQRRLSFAIALLHEPKLLILDEPTVGVDPILRKLIWNHFRKLTLDGDTTIIVTTHYIEEVRQAHMVGLMRSGQLLAQDAPQVLLRHHGAKTLEEVFLSLCVKDDMLSGRSSRVLTPTSNHLQESDHVESDVDDLSIKTYEKMFQQSSSVDHIKAMVLKNFHWMRHEYLMALTFIAIGPFLMLLICIMLGGNPRNVKLAVVNGEWPQEPICQPLDDCLFLNLSCTFLHGIDRDMISLVPYENEDTAVSAVENGDIYGLITFSSNYSHSFSQRMLEGLNVDNSSLQNSVLNLRMDMINYHLVMMVQRLFLMRYEEFYQEIMKLCKVNSVLGLSPVHLGEPIYGSNSPVFIEYIAPGALILCLFLVTFASSTVTIILERKDGMLERTVVAGVRHAEFLAAILVNQAILFFSPMMGMFLVMYLCLGIAVNSSLPWFLLLCFMQGICAISLGMLIGLVCPSFESALFMAIGIFIYDNVMVGLIWPMEGVWSPVMRWMCCYTNPLTWALEAARSMFSRGWTLTAMAVWPGFASTIIWTAVFFTFTLFALKGFRVTLVKLKHWVLLSCWYHRFGSK